MRKDPAKIVPIDSIRPDPDQPRKKFNEETLQRLADTFVDGGQHNPVKVDSDGLIGSGERRWRAAKLAGWTELWVEVVYPENEFEWKKMRVVENEQHEPLDAWDAVMAYNDLYETQVRETGDSSQTQLAKTLGIGDTTLSNAIAIFADARMTPELRDLMERGSLSSAFTIAIARLPKGSDVVTQRLLEAVEKGVEVNHGGAASALTSAVRLHPDQVHESMSIFLRQGISEFQRNTLLRRVGKEEKTGADYMMTLHGQVRGMRKFLADAEYSPKNVKPEYQPGIKSDLVLLSRDISTYLFEEEERND